MSYYEEKRRVFNVIEHLIKKSNVGIDENVLIYDLTTKYKIGELTIKKRLKLMIDIKMIESSAGILIWKK